MPTTTATPALYVTTFCNFAHRMKDGKPIDHECYIIPPALLRAEHDETPDRDALWSAWCRGPRRVVNRTGRKS
jgi:hypothetical protein